MDFLDFLFTGKNFPNLYFCRFVQYNPTSLERGYKFDLHTEHDLGIPIDLVDPEAYNIDPNGS